MNDWIDKWKVEIGCVFLILVMSVMLFELPGLITLIIFLIFFFLPPYLLLSNFDISYLEKIVLSLFLGLGLTPFFVYYLNLVIPSLKASAIIVICFGLAIGSYFRFYKKK